MVLFEKWHWNQQKQQPPQPLLTSNNISIFHTSDVYELSVWLEFQFNGNNQQQKTKSKKRNETMSFRHLRLNNNNEHFIYYPPSYLMINYFPKDSFLLCLSFGFWFCCAFAFRLLRACVCVHLSTSFCCQMRINTLWYYLASITQSFVQLVGVAMVAMVRGWCRPCTTLIVLFGYFSSIYCRLFSLSSPFTHFVSFYIKWNILNKAAIAV